MRTHGMVFRLVNIALKDVKRHLSVKLHTFIRRVASCKVITSKFNEFERLTELKMFFPKTNPPCSFRSRHAMKIHYCNSHLLV